MTLRTPNCNSTPSNQGQPAHHPNINQSRPDYSPRRSFSICSNAAARSSAGLTDSLVSAKSPSTADSTLGEDAALEQLAKFIATLASFKAKRMTSGLRARTTAPRSPLTQIDSMPPPGASPPIRSASPNTSHRQTSACPAQTLASAPTPHPRDLPTHPQPSTQAKATTTSYTLARTVDAAPSLTGDPGKPNPNRSNGRGDPADPS